MHGDSSNSDDRGVFEGLTAEKGRGSVLAKVDAKTQTGRFRDGEGRHGGNEQGTKGRHRVGRVLGQLQESEEQIEMGWVALKRCEMWFCIDWTSS